MSPAAADAPVARGWSWRWLVDSPLVLATWLAVGGVCVTMLDAVTAVGSAERVRRELDYALARIAAETAAFQWQEAHDVGVLEVGGVAVEVERTASEWRLASRLADGSTWRFRCDALSGAAPAALAGGVVSSSADVEPEAWPQLDPAAVATARRADVLPAFRRDAGLALMHWSAGTEADDFSLDPVRCRRGLVDGGLIVVPGHLWIEARREPWTIELDRDLTVVVQGNAYLGGNVVVRGAGRLLVVATPGVGASFADRDGNGRWSAGDRALVGARGKGPLEGAGVVHVGFAGRPAPETLDFGLVAVHAHLHHDATFAGPVLLSHGTTSLGSRPATVTSSGRWSFAVQRERVPGFSTVGAPRPGLLRDDAGNPAVGVEQPLYLASPAR
jgi:hypothetical protein